MTICRKDAVTYREESSKNGIPKHNASPPFLRLVGFDLESTIAKQVSLGSTRLYLVQAIARRRICDGETFPYLDVVHPVAQLDQSFGAQHVYGD